MPERKILRIRPSLRRSLAITGLGVLRVEQPPGEETSLHGHDLLELGFIERGGLTQELPGKSIACRAGSLFVMPVGCQHAYRVGPDGCVLWNLVIDRDRFARPALPAPLDGRFGRLLAATGGPALFTGLDLAPGLAAIHREQGARAAGWAQAILAQATALAIAIARAMEPAPDATPFGAPSPLDALCHDIEADPARDWTIARMCARARLGRGALIRAFARDRGCPPALFVRQARLRLARAQILAGTGLLHAAELSGYGSVSALVRAAHRTTGTTPAAWRGAVAPR